MTFALKSLILSTAIALVTWSAVLASGINRTHVIDLVNQDRIAVGLAPVAENSQLNAAAHTKALEMLSHRVFDHYMPDGHTPWQYILTEGYNFSAAGENLAMGWQTAESQHRAWLASPTHRANIVNPDYRDIGVAVVEGELEGKQTTLVVEFFGAQQTNAQHAVGSLAAYLAKLLGI